MSFNGRMNQLFLITEIIPQMYIDSVLLVREVKKQPMIYDSWLRRDQFSLFAAWETVINAVIPHFAVMADDDKFLIRKKLRSRWSWMRGTLRRDLSRNNMQCHKHLKWMKEMEFLVPLMLRRYKGSSLKKQGRKGSFESSTSNAVSSSTITTGSHTIDDTPRQLLPASSYQFTLPTEDSNEILIKSFISSYGSEAVLSSTDPDINFLFVLLHVFRKASPVQKAIVRKKLEIHRP